MDWQYVLGVLHFVVQPMSLLTMVLSVFFGLIVGMLPGLTATMAVALLTGLTYKLSNEVAILSLVAVYIGAISGGCQSAILMNIPGTPASAATAVDGFPIGQRGEGGLGILHKNMTIAASGHCPIRTAPVTAMLINAFMLRLKFLREIQPFL